MSKESVTTGKHNDYVGGIASQGRIPGADQATSGSMFVETFPRERRDQPTEHVPEGYSEPNQHRFAGSNTSGSGGDTQPGLRTAMPTQFTNEPQPPASRVVVDDDPFAEPPKASDTMSGATSADLHRGIGHPGSGMSSAERHHG